MFGEAKKLNLRHVFSKLFTPLHLAIRPTLNRLNLLKFKVLSSPNRVVKNNYAVISANVSVRTVRSGVGARVVLNNQVQKGKFITAAPFASKCPWKAVIRKRSSKVRGVAPDNSHQQYFHYLKIVILCQ